MQIIKTIGNSNLMNREKTLFICSKRTPIELYGHVFRWTDCLTVQDCVACFNSTELEAEMVKTLLVAQIPTILFVMNRFTDINNIQIERALQEQRMLIVVLKRDEPKEMGLTPKLRNEYVLSLCQRVVCGYVNPSGSVYKLLSNSNNVEKLIDENVGLMASEPNNHYERWTVAQDKILLRMYYEDMGIHAIYKKLQRSYSAIYTRIRSITQPEKVLKGREFEDYVLSLFTIHGNNQLVLLEWQGDKSLGEIKPENNSNPDFVFQYDNKLFAVECKWREKLMNDMGKFLFPLTKIEIYKKFSETRRMPVTIVLGVGGEPCAPEFLYIIPLNALVDIVSHTQSIAKFLMHSQTFDITIFLSHSIF